MGRVRALSQRWPWHWLAVAAVAMLAALSIGTGIAGRAAIRDAQVESCRRGNLVRADRIIDIRDPDDGPAERARVPVIFPLLDCPATINGDGQVLLTKSESGRYVDLVERKRFPIVKDGQVVGSEPFPAPP